MAWLALRRAGFSAAATLALLLPLGLLAGLAALLDPPRFAFGVAPALVALALGWLLVLLLTAEVAGLMLAGVALAIAAGFAAAASMPDAGRIGVGAVLATSAAALLLAAAARPGTAALAGRLGLNIAAGLTMSYGEIFENVRAGMRLNVRDLTFAAFEGIVVDPRFYYP